MFCLEAQKDTRLPNARKKAISVFPPDMPDGTLAVLDCRRPGITGRQIVFGPHEE